ncbi:unnamed protein product [Cunninghamella blakesleeana]
MRFNIFAFGTIALSFFQLASASSSIDANHGMVSVNEKPLSSNAGSFVERDGLVEGLLNEVKEIISALKSSNVKILDDDFLNLKEEDIISKILSLLGLSGNSSSNSVAGGLGNTSGDKEPEKVITKVIKDGEDDEGDEDNREDQVNVIIIATQKLLCSEGINVEFLDKDNVLSSNSGSCVKSDHHDINLIQTVVSLLGKLLLKGGLGLGNDKEGLLGGLLCTVTKLVHCLLNELLGGVGDIGGIGGGSIAGIKREALRRTLVEAVKARRSMN